jgi:hypothetical protein
VAFREDSFAGFINSGIRQSGPTAATCRMVPDTGGCCAERNKGHSLHSPPKLRHSPGVILAFHAAGSCVSDLASRHGTGKTESKYASSPKN